MPVIMRMKGCGARCSMFLLAVVCENTDGRCNAGWPPSWCDHAKYGATVRSGCPVMCSLCTPGVFVFQVVFFVEIISTLE